MTTNTTLAEAIRALIPDEQCLGFDREDNDIFGHSDAQVRALLDAAAALVEAQETQEPVAWRYQRDTQSRPGVGDGQWRATTDCKMALELQGKAPEGAPWIANPSYHCWEPLYAQPPQVSATPVDGCQGERADAADAGALSNGQIRTLMHNYSRMCQPGHYSDTEFDCLQDVIAFVRECIKRARPTASTTPVAEDASRVARKTDAIALAYGYLWHIGAGIDAPTECRVLTIPTEEAAWRARKALFDLLTHEQRGEGIRAVIAAMAPTTTRSE